MKRTVNMILLFIAACIMSVAALCACGKKDEGNTDSGQVDSTQVNEFTVEYKAGEGGYISGIEKQAIKKGNDSYQVVAKPEKGYEFVNWSDGKTDAYRKDYYVTSDISVTANFTRIVRTYQLNYSSATDNIAETEVTLTYNELEDITLPVPSREHFTFAGWYYGDMQISDAEGRFLLGNEIFDTEKTQFVATWTPNKSFTYDEPFAYKILLVYVTEIHATLPSKEVPNMVTVNYEMPEVERQICGLITKQLKYYLDDMMEGMVEFQVDEYYTTEPIVTENFHQKPGDNNLLPNNIPEVSELLTNYDSVLSVINLQDYRAEFVRNCAGMATNKYGQVYLDAFFADSVLNNIPIETFFDLSYKGWDNEIETYIHELAHTIELRMHLSTNDGLDFHHVEAALHMDQQIYGIAADKLYFMNKAIINGKRMGIPYDFWAGNILTVRYEETEGGHVNWHEYEVIYGYDLPHVEATPDWNGRYYQSEFLGWSDGITTQTRQDKNITESFTVTAIFKPRTWEIRYEATEGGSIIGEALQTAKFQEQFTRVEAVAEEGYVFVGWSDGWALSKRGYDGTFGIYLDELFHGEFTVTVTAIFEKILNLKDNELCKNPY